MSSCESAVPPLPLMTACVPVFLSLQMQPCEALMPEAATAILWHQRDVPNTPRITECKDVECVFDGIIEPLHLTPAFLNGKCTSQDFPSGAVAILTPGAKQ